MALENSCFCTRGGPLTVEITSGIQPDIIVIYTTSPILLIFCLKVPHKLEFKNLKNLWPQTPMGHDMAI